MSGQQLNIKGQLWSNQSIISVCGALTSFLPLQLLCRRLGMREKDMLCAEHQDAEKGRALCGNAFYWRVFLRIRITVSTSDNYVLLYEIIVGQVSQLPFNLRHCSTLPNTECSSCQFCPVIYRRNIFLEKNNLITSNFLLSCHFGKHEQFRHTVEVLCGYLYLIKIWLPLNKAFKVLLGIF